MAIGYPAANDTLPNMSQVPVYVFWQEAGPNLAGRPVSCKPLDSFSHLLTGLDMIARLRSPAASIRK